MEIKFRSLDSNLLCLTCRGVISQLHSGAPDDPLQLIGNWKGNVLLDLQFCEFIDSSGIAWLLHWNRHIDKAGGVFALCAVPPRVDGVFQLCQVHRILSIWEDEKAARAALAVSAPQASERSAIGPSQGSTNDSA